MASATFDTILAAYEKAKPTSGADYDVLSSPGTIRGGHLAVAKSGAPALLVPIAKVGSHATRLTHGLALRGATTLEFARGADRWTETAAVIECREPRLVRTFAGLVAALVARLETTTKASWDTIASLFLEWERLLARREILSGESELGLWGELWCLARTVRPVDLLEGWRGPERERVDFLLGGYGFEVKAGRRPGVHMVSQEQVDSPLGDARGVLVSMHVMPDPLRGHTLPELVAVVSARTGDVAAFEEKLAATGYSRDDEPAYVRRHALLEAPKFYFVEDVPRVRAADPGVSKIRYRVELPPDKAVSDSELAVITNTLGIDPASHEYPCA